MFFNQVDFTKNPFWKYLLGSFVVIIFSFIGQAPLTYFIVEAGPMTSNADPMSLLRVLDKNLTVVFTFDSFCDGIFRILACSKIKLHEHSLSVTTSRSRSIGHRVFYAFFLWGSLSVVLIIGDYFISPESYEWNFNFKSFRYFLLLQLL